MIDDDVVYSIYMITGPCGKYIGKTKNLTSRIYDHRAVKGKYKNHRLVDSILKYGWENHIVQVLEEITNDEDFAYAREYFWVNHHKTNFNRWPEENGFNLSDGGRGNLGSTGKSPKKEVDHTYKGGFVVKNIPEDIHKIILETQASIKIDRRISQFSQSATIYHIVRKYQEQVERKTKGL